MKTSKRDRGKSSLSAVIWRDVTTLSGGWMDEDEAEIQGMIEHLERYTTVGKIIHSNKDYVLIASTWDGSGGYNDISLIPRGVIVQIISDVNRPKRLH